MKKGPRKSIERLKAEEMVMSGVSKYRACLDCGLSRSALDKWAKEIGLTKRNTKKSSNCEIR